MNSDFENLPDEINNLIDAARTLTEARSWNNLGALKDAVGNLDRAVDPFPMEAWLAYDVDDNGQPLMRTLCVEPLSGRTLTSWDVCKKVTITPVEGD